MSVAERRRGLLLGQRPVYRHWSKSTNIRMSVCLEPRSSGKAEQQQNKDAQLLRGGSGGRGGPASLRPASKQKLFRPHRQDEPARQCILRTVCREGIREDREEGHGDREPSASQAGRALSEGGHASTLLPCLRLWYCEASCYREAWAEGREKGPPRRARLLKDLEQR